LSISFLGETRWGRVSFDTMAGRTGDLGRIEQHARAVDLVGAMVGGRNACDQGDDESERHHSGARQPDRAT
jgi:hypothetical protein